MITQTNALTSNSTSPPTEVPKDIGKEDYNSLAKKYEELSKTINDQQIRMVEVLAIFAALISVILVFWQTSINQNITSQNFGTFIACIITFVCIMISFVWILVWLLHKTNQMY